MYVLIVMNLLKSLTEFTPYIHKLIITILYIKFWD